MFDKGEKIIYNAIAINFSTLNGGVGNGSSSANWKLTTPNLSECPQCHELKENHKACPNCGYYGGELVVEKKEKKSN